MSATPSFLRKYMGVPVGVKNGGGVSAEEGHQLGGAAILVDGDDSESTTTTCFPVDGDVLRIGLRGYERSCSRVACKAMLTLIRFVSQAFFEMRRLS
jgi:hypothetical protein